MSVEVRAALDVDLDALIQLNRVVQSLHVALYPGDFTPVVEPPAVSAFFAARLASPTSMIGIARRIACLWATSGSKCRRDRKRRLLPLDPASMCTTSRLRRKLVAVELRLP